MATTKHPVIAWSEEWTEYYRSAAHRALSIGDPLKRHLERHLLRQRLFLLACGIGLVLIAGLFIHVAS